MKWLSKTLTAALAASFAAEVYGAAGCLSSYCVAGTTRLILSSCLLTDDDFDAIAACFTTAGLNTVTKVYLADNSFTTIPSDLFTGLTALEGLYVYSNPLTSLDAATFQPVASTLSDLRMYGNELTTIPAGLFDGMVALKYLYLHENLMTTLAAGVFDGLTSVIILNLAGNLLPTITPGLFDGMVALQYLYLRENPLTSLSAGVFDGLTSVTRLYLNDAQLTTIPTGLFATMASLEELYLQDGMLTELEVDSFVGLTSVEQVDLRNNFLTTRPDGVFDTLGDASSLNWLLLGGNDELQCIPSSVAAMSSSSSDTSSTYRDEVPNAGLCECTGVATCDEGSTCSDGTEGYTCNAIVACADDSDCDTGAGEACCLSKLICEVPDTADPGACGDPHMTGFRGQKFDFTGEDGSWYAVVSDLPYIHLNMRVTSPVPSLPEITYITGISIITTDGDDLEHAIVISVSDPHSMESDCPVGRSSCLADGALHVVANGQEIMLTPDEVTLAPGVAIAAVNLPGECRSFGFEQYWEQKKLQLAQPGRRLSGGDVLQDMSDWVLADPTATNMEECEEYVAAAVDGSGLFEHQSEHASFQIMTPTTTIRLSHGRLHQVSMRDPTDQYDLPDHLAWQMNMAIDHSEMSVDATGILGETLVPTLDHTGAPIMQGMDAIRGAQEDYRVSGPLGVLFSQNQHHE